MLLIAYQMKSENLNKQNEPLIADTILVSCNLSLESVPLQIHCMFLKGDYFHLFHNVFCRYQEENKVIFVFCPVKSVVITPFGTEDSILAVINVREGQQPVEVCVECSMSKCLAINFVFHMIVVARQEYAFSRERMLP